MHTISFVVSFLQLHFYLLNNLAAGFVFEPHHLSSLEGLHLEELWSQRGELCQLLLESRPRHVFTLVGSVLGNTLENVLHWQHLLLLTGEDLSQLLLKS